MLSLEMTTWSSPSRMREVKEVMMMNSTRSNSVNIFVLLLLPERAGMVSFLLDQSQLEDTHIDDEDYENPRQERNQYLCAESLAESAGGCASGRRGV